MTTLSMIILAAGQGSRMKSPLPKVLHTVGGVPMVEFPIRHAQKLKVKKTILVVPPHSDPIQKGISPSLLVQWATQKKPLGTAHAVMAAVPFFKTSDNSGDVLIVYGDMPLLTHDTLAHFVAAHRTAKKPLTFMSAVLDRPMAYGRVVRDRLGAIQKIVEEKDATPQQKKIKEVNVGVYVVNVGFLKKALQKISTKNAQKEYYLTDLIEIAVQENNLQGYRLTNSVEAMGVNTQKELAFAEEIFCRQKIEKLMSEGVRFFNPSSIIIDDSVTIGAGSIVMGPATLLKNTVIGTEVIIEPNNFISNTKIGDSCHIKAGCYLDSAQLEESVTIGPMAHLRPQTLLKKKSKVGNFVEIKKSVIGPAAKVNHLSYIGDATVGAEVNIGAGCITCNYDGTHKYQTIIHDGAFIGSDSQLVAPVTIGRGAYVGSGSTITKNVSDYSLAFTRPQQTEIKNWTKRKKK